LDGDSKARQCAVADRALGILSTSQSSFKASFILSAAFRDLVAPTHGWPVYVVAPARDFVYVISHRDHDFLARLGGVVMQEYEQSGHSITAEVLEVGDHGVRAIGAFAQE
jgi:hypothetical protein